MSDLSRMPVGVIMPTFRRRQPLLKAVRSVLNQTHREVECHVVDDASGDDSLAVLDVIQDSRLRIHALDKNGGPAGARNFGVQQSSAEVIAFLDSDDYWFPNKLEAMLKAMGGVEPAPGWICGHSYSENDRRGVTDSRPLETIADIGDHLFFRFQTFQTSTWMMSRACLEAEPFDPDWPRHEDWNVLLRWQRRGFEFYFIDQPLAVRRRHQADCLSSARDCEVTARFLKEHSGHLSSRARAGFRGHILAAKHWLSGKRLQSLRDMTGCWMEAELGCKEGLQLFTYLARANGRRLQSRIFSPC